MHPNDVQLVRVWTREVGGTTGDVTFPNNANFEIVVDVEAGLTKFNDGPPFTVGVVVKDMTHWSICPAQHGLPTGHECTVDTPPSINNPTIRGGLSTPCWPNQAHQFVFKVVAADLIPPGPDRTDHIFSAHARLAVGAGQPNVSFAESPSFTVHKP